MSRHLLRGALAALALAAPAQANTDYSVTVTGEASYNRADVYSDSTAGQHDHRFVFRTTVSTVRFHGDGRTTVLPGAESSATVTRSHFALTGPKGERFECSGGTADGVRPGSLRATGSAFTVRPLGALSVKVSTCDYPLTPGALRLLDARPLDGRFRIRRAEVGDRRIVRRLSGDTRDARCPLQNPNTDLCSLSWKTRITFVRDDDPLVVPLVPDQRPRRDASA